MQTQQQASIKNESGPGHLLWEHAADMSGLEQDNRREGGEASFDSTAVRGLLL